MTKKELAEHNAKVIARISERRRRRLEAMKQPSSLKTIKAVIAAAPTLAQAVDQGKLGKVRATAHVSPTATPELKEALTAMAVTAAATADPEKLTLKELRAEAKRLNPKLKGMADAHRVELEFLIRYPGQDEDADEIVAIKKAWRHRWEIRVNGWKQGDSPSAQALREEAKTK